MKFARKLIIALIVAICSVLGVFSWLLVNRELKAFDEDARSDHELIATTLGGSVAMVWRNRGADRALALVHEADRLRAHMRLRWVWPDAGDPALAPLVSAAALEARKPGANAHTTERLRFDGTKLVADRQGEEWLISYRGVETPSGRVGAIELAESLDRKRESSRMALTTLTTMTLSLISVCAVLVLFLGVWFVGRPLAKLAEKAQRVGAGDLTGTLSLSQKDEIGDLAHEMNLMCERLAEADQRVKAETAARVATLEQLRHADRLRTVGQLSAGVAHELGTPLNIVLGRAKMIAQGKATGQKLHDYAVIISEQAERMARIIRQLLDYARVREPRTHRHDLSRLVQQTVDLIKPLAQRREVQIEVMTQGSVFAPIDVAQVQQALTNVIVNAVHASPGNKVVTITTGQLRAAKPELGLCEREYGFVRVRDAGSGIDQNTLERIFDPFFTTKPIGEGTGLGLAVTQGIVSEHQGWISAESEPGRGSTFTIHLPLAAAPVLDVPSADLTAPS
ncbi:MAG TPA: HAMP domain-containing sensor histidine kinase [Polyangiaceae bacterium]